MKDLESEVLIVSLKKDIEKCEGFVYAIENRTKSIDINIEIGDWIRFNTKECFFETKEIEEVIVSKLKEHILFLEEEIKRCESRIT